jgi:hypothetical protein
MFPCWQIAKSHSKCGNCHKPIRKGEERLRVGLEGNQFFCSPCGEDWVTNFAKKILELKEKRVLLIIFEIGGEALIWEKRSQKREYPVPHLSVVQGTKERR